MEYKGFTIFTGDFMQKQISRIGSGKLPVSLLGTFTTGVYAQNAIDSYLNTKGTKDGKSVSSA